MDYWNQGLGTLSEAVLCRLADMLDNVQCGWRQLASIVTEEPQFRCSEREVTSCSLQVLSAKGSPGRYLLALLADKSCTLSYLSQYLTKMGHTEAANYLTNTVRSMTEQIVITEQPQPERVQEGQTLTLTCKATGPPGLEYQWFKGKDEVQGGNRCELVLSSVGSAHAGHYICRMNCGETCVFSQWAKVSVVSSDRDSTGFAPSLVSGLRIIHQPRSQTVSEGETLYLECSAEANPPPQYQWFHNQEPIKMANKAFLKVPCVNTADRGSYRCRVYNLYHEEWSDEVHVNIGPSSFLESFWALSIFDNDNHSFINQISDCCNPCLRCLCATDKVALLLGNMNYQHHRQLRAPMADVHELTNLLRQLDFKVVSLLDLNRQEMHSAVTEFLLLLDRGVYGLLYFAGHGYENYGNSFMVPIDAPASYTSEHCLWVQDILQRMQERQTGLNVFLLDMCRKRNPNDDVIPQPGPLRVTANIVFGYATCVDAEAYEVNEDDLSNGIFISFLKRRLLEDEKVTVMLDRVAEDMGRCEITRGRQALELRSNLSERRALTDRIQAPDCSVTATTRNLQWAIAHVIPDSQCLKFDCGVKVQLGFAAEFSNIMIIYTRILETPKDIVSCSAQLSNFSEGPEVDLKLTNQESLRDAGSLLLTMDNLLTPEVPRLFTRLCALQRLKTDLSFTVCLQYRYSNLDEEIQERRTVSVGKPLVSKLNLHEPRLPRSFSASSSSDLHTFSIPESSSFCDDLVGNFMACEVSSAGSASTSWSYYSQSGELSAPSSSRRENLPEENESPEYLAPDVSQPPVASKSLPHYSVDELDLKFSNMPNFHSF
ncbi:LOW QUALITY PROTEIN: mucosa-associated lymphoid tissue lymphoma translocation protein 1 [Chanos chanos]|uniref:LOW QUALITY PROTEIN: mucosa-associated lymphoid tissue lymphoma translocation protein 1 n=1 Tax=Chanos chanos TaxID=29144 RepID=A0AC58UVX1_CHACN